MTRESYFDMCKALNSEPVEEEIPVEHADLPVLAQTCLSIYECLNDEWEYMGGNYVGKDLTYLFEVFKMYKIPEDEYLIVYKIISIIDRERKILIRSKRTD